MKCLKFMMVATMSLFMLSLLVGLSPTTAEADDNAVVKWKRIIGAIPVHGFGTNFVGSGTGQVTPTPIPTTATRGKARVDLESGDIRFKVQGLVIAGDNDIGTPGPVTDVKGTLVCDTDGSVNGNSFLVNTPSVAITPQGDAKFKGTVSPLPAECMTEPDIAFLIRVVNPAFLVDLWIGAGVVRR